MLENLTAVQREGCRKTLILWGVIACLWFLQMTKHGWGDFALPEEGYRRVYLMMQDVRAFVYMVMVPAYGFFQPDSCFQPTQRWLFRILFLMLLQYQMFVIPSRSSSADGADHSCDSSPWQVDIGKTTLFDLLTSFFVLFSNLSSLSPHQVSSCTLFPNHF